MRPSVPRCRGDSPESFMNSCTDSRIPVQIRGFLHRFIIRYQDLDMILQNRSWIPAQIHRIYNKFSDYDSRIPIHGFLHGFTDSCMDSRIPAWIHGFWHRFSDSDSRILMSGFLHRLTDSGTDSWIPGFMNQNTVECTKIPRVANPSAFTVGR